MSDEPVPPQTNKGLARLVIALVLLVLLIAFVFANTRKVTVGFVFFDTHIRLIFVLLGTIAIGIIIDRLWIYWRRQR
jgi:uncharacterized integral membrane protein